MACTSTPHDLKSAGLRMIPHSGSYDHPLRAWQIGVTTEIPRFCAQLRSPLDFMAGVAYPYSLITATDSL